MVLRRWERTDSAGGALGCIGLLFRPQPGTVPAGHGDGLVFAPEPGTVGLGYWVLERARRRGLASRAVALLVPWAFGDAGMVRVEALVEPDNVPSQRVLERAGFRREGHLRAYLDLELDGRRSDACIYSLLRGDLGHEYEGPGPFSSCAATMSGMDGHANPVEAAMGSMPAGITHVVEVDEKPGGESAYVLLAG